MKKLILISLLAAFANAYQSTLIVNDSKCELHENKYFADKGVSFMSKPNVIHSHKSAPISINYHNVRAHEDEYLAGIGYNVVCGGESGGYVILEFSPEEIGIGLSKNVKVKLNESASTFSKLVFTDK